VPDYIWYCPLLERDVEDGECTDINYQRVGLFKKDYLLEVEGETNKSTLEVSEICEKCPNLSKVFPN